MDFLHQFKLSFQFYWRAFRFIDTHELWKLLIVPAIINLIIAFLTVIFAIKTSGYIVEAVFTHFKFTNTDTSISAFIEGLLLVFIRAAVFFLYLKVYRYMALILLAPLFAFLSSRVQTIDTGHSERSCTSKYLMDCSRGIKIALRNFVIEIALSTVIIIVFLLISWIIPLAPVVILVVESYFMGYSMVDYRNEFFKISSRNSRKVINNYIGLVIGNGLFFNIFLLIPLLGVLFAPTFALVAAGLSVNYVEKRKSILWNSDQSTLMMAES